jgi:hypothetical protein
MFASDQSTLIDRLCGYVREAFEQYTQFLMENCSSYSEYCRNAETVGMRATAEVAAKWRDLGEYVILLPKDQYDAFPEQIGARDRDR